MRIWRLAALSLAAVLTAGMLTGCPWDKDDAASSDLPGGSSGSTSQGGSGDTGNAGGSTTPTEPTFTITPPVNGKVEYEVTENPNGTYSVTFTITPDEGFSLVQVTVGDQTFDTSDLTPKDGVYTHTANVPAGTNATVTVTFKADKNYTTSEDGKTYIVYSAAGLLAWNTAAQSDLSLNCTLAADINLSGETWTPIGNTSSRYTGTFDGQGHTVSGLTVNTPDETCVGMFGCVGETGKVQNLNLENVNISDSNNVGGVAGWNKGAITGCMVSGSVSGNNCVGGVAGNNEGAITGCMVSEGNVTASASKKSAGGMAGVNHGTITGCMVSEGSVAATGEEANAGGVAGGNEGTVKGCCFAGGSVTGFCAGGVVGMNLDTITDCYWQKGPDAAVGNDSGADGCTPIGDGATLNDAIEKMNTYLTGYHYVLEGDKPVLKPLSANTMLAEHFGLRWPF